MIGQLIVGAIEIGLLVWIKSHTWVRRGDGR
jgi:hypothetical protein